MLKVFLISKYFYFLILRHMEGIRSDSKLFGQCSIINVQHFISCKSPKAFQMGKESHQITCDFRVSVKAGTPPATSRIQPESPGIPPETPGTPTGTPRTPPGTPGTPPGTPGTPPGTPGTPTGKPGTLFGIPKNHTLNTLEHAGIRAMKQWTCLILYKFTCFALNSG
jgi:hypothetical protein